ncbi:hypothetical protein TgHK011_004074 [Trichoderma gracile]|nr:hypothetical protein TgHK011_004074 [Trichoderma gracile]
MDHHPPPKEEPQEEGQTPAASPTAELPKVLDVLVSFARACFCCRTGPFLAGLLQRAASKASSVAARISTSRLARKSQPWTVPEKVGRSSLVHRISTQ